MRAYDIEFDIDSLVEEIEARKRDRDERRRQKHGSFDRTTPALPDEPTAHPRHRRFASDH